MGVLIYQYLSVGGLKTVFELRSMLQANTGETFVFKIIAQDESGSLSRYIDNANCFGNMVRNMLSSFFICADRVRLGGQHHWSCGL